MSSAHRSPFAIVSVAALAFLAGCGQPAAPVADPAAAKKAAKAREAIAQKQREYEPGRALITTEDVASALRRARVRS
jgi:hypothetical protein